MNRELTGARNVIISDLVLTELASALGRRCRELRMTQREAEHIYREATKLKSAVQPAELTPSAHRRAEMLLVTVKIPLRALDALHLAMALEASAATFITFDSRLHESAFACGLMAKPDGIS